jgi:predicted O-methyltransferase YrrM
MEFLEKQGHIVETQHRNYGALLFRIVNHFNCRNMLQIGTFTGVMSLYAASASRQCECYTIDENPELTKDAKRFAEIKKFTNLHFMTGECDEILDKLKNTTPKFDLVFVNCKGNEERTREAICKIRSFISENTVLVIDGIWNGKGMKSLWKSLENMTDVRVTLDLYALGIVLFNKKLNKQHYKIYFDYGKKQNLHRKGRRRTYFTRRR